ncbi:hypothetical protein [Streptomyces sp. TRM75563]|uniref:hypothetical protein n=1 Tax=Streptomyces sp. TRM75563 TaxID=2817418 RepID=UPI001F61EBDE|nr:hypothetical protein [Streptomyces sp. TRM75563]MCI4042700.1 hypothetical protein [Streptomyces sp. TRM75563]
MTSPRTIARPRTPERPSRSAASEHFCADRPWQFHYAREPQETFCDELLSGLADERNDDIAIVTLRTGPPHTGPAVAVP